LAVESKRKYTKIKLNIVCGSHAFSDNREFHLQNIWSSDHFEATWLLWKNVLQEEIDMSNGNTWMTHTQTVPIVF